MSPTMTPKDLRRFTRKYINTGPGGCWLWTASRRDDGYGQFRLDGTIRKAHRVAYQHHVGPVPDGLELDHLCRHRGCVNPAHLEAVTHAENCRRGDGGKYWAAKTHCPQGHPYAGENLVIWKSGGRRCRTCLNAQQRARRKAVG